MGLLLSTIASGLLFGARDSAARSFALAYAIVYVLREGIPLTNRSAGILIYGWATFQKRLTMISARDAGSFGKSSVETRLISRSSMGPGNHMPRTLHCHTGQLLVPVAGGGPQYRD